jgi:DNA-binding LacI/PurR family transcriptional regulator
MTVTLKDIAAHVRLTPTAVSYALRGSDQVAPKTRRRVRRAARELGYRPNSAARSLARGRHSCVALLQSTRGGRSTLGEGLLRGIHDELARRDFRLTIAYLPDERLTDPAFVPAILREWSADGLLINYTDHIARRMIELIERSRHPAVWVNTKGEHDCVYPDDLGAAVRLTRWLIGRGHRRIAYVDYGHFPSEMPEAHYSARDRRDGYLQALRQAGLSAFMVDDRARVPHGVLRSHDWTAMVRQWLTGPQGATGALCYSPHEAGAALLTARDLGLRAGEDVDVGVFADEEMYFAGRLVPTMVCMRGALGRRSARMLLEKFSHARGPMDSLALPFEARGLD